MVDVDKAARPYFRACEASPQDRGLILADASTTLGEPPGGLSVRRGPLRTLGDVELITADYVA